MSIKSNIRKNSTLMKYIILTLVFIIFVFTITATYLIINLSEQGTSYVSNNYYDINMSNATIDFETTSKIKLDNDNDVINININDLDKYTKGNSFNIELYNIGNMSACINGIKITDIKSNIDIDLVDIDLSLEKGKIISASEKKILNVLVKYNEKNPEVDEYINFNIRITYKEIIN